MQRLRASHFYRVLPGRCHPELLRDLGVDVKYHDDPLEVCGYVARLAYRACGALQYSLALLARAFYDIKSPFSNIFLFCRRILILLGNQEALLLRILPEATFLFSCSSSLSLSIPSRRDAAASSSGISCFSPCRAIRRLCGRVSGRPLSVVRRFSCL